MVSNLCLNRERQAISPQPLGLDLYQYFVEIMTTVTHCEKNEDYEALLHWNIDLVNMTRRN